MKHPATADTRTVRHIPVKTPDDWYPTTDGVVSASLLPISTGEWRVCLWGGDDFGMEKDVDTYEEAKESFDLIVGQDYITKSDLTGLGFKGAS